MNTKYQIFVSSTYKDLKEERDLVIKAALEMGHIPVGMEMFSAADEEQWKIIKKQIDQSDYYVVIAAHRYGSCTESGISYTEMEYDYAVENGIPVLGFIIEEGTSWPREKSETTKKNIDKIKLFKEKIQSKHVSYWKNQDDLYGKCAIALMKAFNAYPREGWVRASIIQQDINSSKEMVRLSSENFSLREKIEELEKEVSDKKNMEKAISIFKSNERKISVWKRGASDWEDSGKYSLYEIFEVLAPELQVEMSLDGITKFIASHISGVPPKEQRATWPTPRNTARSILADFAALNCIIPSSKKKPIEDQNEYWCLGEFGIELLSFMRRRRLENIEKSTKIEASVEGENDL